MDVQRRDGGILLLLRPRPEAVPQDTEGVIRRPRDKVAAEIRGLKHRLFLSADIVAELIQESVGMLQEHASDAGIRDIF